MTMLECSPDQGSAHMTTHVACQTIRNISKQTQLWHRMLTAIIWSLIDQSELSIQSCELELTNQSAGLMCEMSQSMIRLAFFTCHLTMTAASELNDDKHWSDNIQIKILQTRWYCEFLYLFNQNIFFFTETHFSRLVKLFRLNS